MNTNYNALTIDGLWRNNPALVQLLGLCPLLAVSTTFVNGTILGIVTLLVLTASNLLISVIRGTLDQRTRLPLQIMVIATFVTCADLALQSWLFEIHQRIGLFVALIVTNCTVLARSESFASRNPIRASLVDGFMMGAGFLLVIVLLSTVREILGQGTLFHGLELVFGPVAQTWVIQFNFDGLLLVILPPGAFLTFGCLLAAKNWLDQHE
ncbi:MAG: electron transport complex protein RnfE [Granulosicoccus sp.]|jgi:electron transport complex protein RnfE